MDAAHVVAHGPGGPSTEAAGFQYVLPAGPVDGTLSAYDASGAKNCSGTPKTCLPVWQASTGTAGVLDTATRLAGRGSPVADGGKVFAGGASGVYAFYVAGTENCAGSPTICAPVELGEPPRPAGSPTVYDGTLFVASADESASGACRALRLRRHRGRGLQRGPRLCQPLWRGDIGTANPLTGTMPAADGRIFMTTFPWLLAFDSGGASGCTGAKVCPPLWQAYADPG